MGSSYFPRVNINASYSITGPKGPTGNRGETGPTGFGPTGATGVSVTSMGLCGGKLRTNFDNGFTFETQNRIQGQTGNTILIAGISSGQGLNVFHGQSYAGTTLYFRNIRGSKSSSGRAEVSVGLSGESIHLEYTNQSSGYTLTISGSDTIKTFVGYSGSSLASIPKSIHGDSNSILIANFFEKTRGLGYSGGTGSSGITCNYVSGGTLTYVDSEGYVGFTRCNILNIDPACKANNSVDLQVKPKVFVADMKNTVTRVVIQNPGYTGIASAFTLIIANALNGPSAIGQGEKRFSVSPTGGIQWPFDLEPCFCGSDSVNVYHLFNMGYTTWYGSVASMSDATKFYSCPNGYVIQGITEGFGSCCFDDGTPGGSCAYITERDCNLKGNTVFWHEGFICGSSPCTKTGGCCISFSNKSALSSICLDGITCIDCIRGKVYDSFGNTYNGIDFTYLGNGVTCISGASANCPAPSGDSYA